MNIGVMRDTDVAAAHQVPQRLRVHPCPGLIAAAGMAADARGDVRHLEPADIVAALDHMVESVLCMATSGRHPLSGNRKPLCPILIG